MRKIPIALLVLALLALASAPLTAQPGTGPISGGSGGGGLPGANQVTESMLKVVNACTDEYVLTCETTTGDFEWQAAATGDVVGPASATDNAIARYDLTTGKLLQDSAVTIADTTGNLQWEGTTADAFEGNFTFADPTADWTWAWSATGALTGATQFNLENLRLDGNAFSTITPAATTGATVAGQALAITASPAVASTDTAGAAAGGSVTITAGAAARNASGNANGGNIDLVTGAGIGTGTAGQVKIPDGTAAAPALTFASIPNNGIHLQSSAIYVDIGGEAAFRFAGASGQVRIKSSNTFGWASGEDVLNTGLDTTMQRAAAGIVRITSALHLDPRASPPRTCDATAEGDIYSDTSHALCFCDGTSWNVLTGSGAGSCV